MSLTEIANSLYERRGALFQVASGLLKGYAAFEIQKHFLGPEHMEAVNTHDFVEVSKQYGLFLSVSYTSFSSVCDLMVGIVRFKLANRIPADDVLASHRHAIVETQAYEIVRNIR